MSTFENDALDAVEAVLNEEFNAGVASPEPVEARPEADTLLFDDAGRARTPDGKFASLGDSEEEDVPTDAGTEQEAESEEEAPEESEDSEEELSAAEEEAVFEIDDPELLDYLDKYDGDVVAALKAAREAQSLIGRQGNELGELRELREQMEAMQQMLLNQSRAQNIDWDEVIAENPQQAVYMAVEMQNVEAFEEGMRMWASVDPVAAFTFLQQGQQQQTQFQQEATLESEVTALKAKYPDIQQRLPAIQEEAAKRPALARLLNEGDPTTQAQALEDLYHLAGSRTSASDTSKAAKRLVLRTKAEADAAKSDASVVSASNTTAAAAAPANPNEGLQQALRELSGLDDLVIV